MMLLVNVLVEERSVEQPVNVIKTDFQKPIIDAKLEDEAWKARQDFCVLWQIVDSNIFNQEERESCEHETDDVLIDDHIDDDLNNKIY